jgi:hypothetical protein
MPNSPRPVQLCHAPSRWGTTRCLETAVWQTATLHLANGAALAAKVATYRLPPRKWSAQIQQALYSHQAKLASVCNTARNRPRLPGRGGFYRSLSPRRVRQSLRFAFFSSCSTAMLHCSRREPECGHLQQRHPPASRGPEMRALVPSWLRQGHITRNRVFGAQYDDRSRRSLQSYVMRGSTGNGNDDIIAFGSLTAAGMGA